MIRPCINHPASDEAQGAAMDGEDDDQPACQSLQGPKNFLRPSTSEAVVSALCHFTMTLFYVGVHRYDAAVFAEHETIWYRGGGSYGGRWQALTYILLVV